MGARRFRATEYRIESVAPNAHGPEVTQARALSDCMTKLSMLLLAGHRILGVHQGEQHVSRAVYDAMVLLAGRNAMLESIAAALQLSAIEAEKLFGHLFLDGAFVMQGLQGLTSDRN